MTVAERIEKICKFEGSQKVVAEKTGISQGALSAIINRGSQVRSDTIELILRAYPALNARWLITGTGEMWEGAASKSEKAVKNPSPQPNPELLNRLLVQKLEAVAEELKENYPEAYRKLRLEELIKREK